MLPSHLPSARAKSVVLRSSSQLSLVAVLFLGLLGIAIGVASSSEAHTGPNSPPSAVNDGPHTVHDTMVLPQVMTNDSDPDGDTVSFDTFGSEPLHGHLTTGVPEGVIRYTVTTPGYEGPDSFTYRVRDSHGALSNFATVSINVVNQAPIAVNDGYVIRGSQPTLLTPAVMANDVDQDGDNLTFDLIMDEPDHGHLTHGENGAIAYTPQSGFEGTDTFAYKITDQLGERSNVATVTLMVIGGSERLDPCDDPTKGPMAVGQPVDVTTGNMYLQQTDHVLPGAGHMIHIQRTYHSKSTLTGLFGKG